VQSPTNRALPNRHRDRAIVGPLRPFSYACVRKEANARPTVVLAKQSDRAEILHCKKRSSFLRQRGIHSQSCLRLPCGSALTFCAPIRGSRTRSGARALVDGPRIRSVPARPRLCGLDQSTKRPPASPKMSLRSCVFKRKAGSAPRLCLFEGVADGSDALQGNKSPAVKVY
jgi:hypothetical protein